LARKNGWTIAEHVGEAGPKPLQRLLNLSPWHADELVELNRRYAMENLADPGAILVADPTGFAKKGRKSVGVQRQYSGTRGRVDNCQIATFLAYVTPGRDRVLIDHRLYLPETSWVADPDRCAEAGVPAEVTFQTRPQQVQDMLEVSIHGVTRWCPAVAGVGIQGLPARAVWMASMAGMLWPRALVR
jgi:SRSO17 transposase